MSDKADKKMFDEYSKMTEAMFDRLISFTSENQRTIMAKNLARVNSKFGPNSMLDKMLGKLNHGSE